MDGETLSEFFEEPASFSSSAAWPDDIFWEKSCYDNNMPTSLENSSAAHDPASLKCGALALPTCKKRKLEEGQQKISHITVERNRRKQMNEHLSVLRSLMPSVYVKRGDQASIIGGVVDYINEVQQLLQSLEAKKQRKAAAYNDVLLSPRLLSPRTPLPSSPYKPRMQQQQQQQQPQLLGFLNSPSSLPSPCNSSTSSINDAVNELVATSTSALSQVQVKFSGPNLMLKTTSRRMPGQVVKIISALEELALEILHVSISTVDETMLNSFTIKIGIQCQLSAEELAELIQRTFCC